MAQAAPAGEWIELRRRFALPWQVIARQWLEPHLLAGWFGPVGYRVSGFRVLPVPGGEWWLTLQAPDGGEATFSGHFLEIDLPYMLRMSWAPGRTAEPSQPTELALILEPRQGSTILRLRHGPFTDPELCEANRIAWASTLDSLALRLADDPGS